MIACPNINHEDYKYAVEKLGKHSALYLYDLLGQEIPTKDQVDSYLNSIEDEYEGIVQEDLSEYGSITVGSKFEGKQELLDKFGIKRSRSHYYYVLSKEEQKRIDSYVTGKWTKGKLGRTRNGFEISDTINGRVRYKYINNKPYLLIDLKEIFEEDGIKLPRKIGSFKVPIDLVYFGDESDYKEFQKKNINYIPYLEKEINKYLFKTKGISLAKSMNFYAYKTSKLLIDLFKEVFNKDVTLEQLFNSNIEELKQLLDSDVFKNKLKDIQNQYEKEINNLDADVIRQDILDRFREAQYTSDEEEYKLFDEQFINDLSILLNYLPDNFIKLVPIDVIYSQTAMFMPQTRNNQNINISKDSITKLMLLKPFRESMSTNIVLRRLYDKGIITNEDIDKANKLLKPAVKKFIQDTGGDYTISRKKYYNKLEILATALGPDKYTSFEIEQYYVLKEIDDYNRTKLNGFMILIDSILNTSNFAQVNDVFGAIKLGNFTKFKGSFAPDNMTIIGHEIGHGIDRYIATVRPKARKDIINFINDLIETKEFQNYIKKGLESRGYDITNKKEITADLFAYIALRSINYSGINYGHLKSLNEFFNNNELLISNIFNKYSFDGFNPLGDNTPIKKQTIFDIFRSIINDIIDVINSFVGKNIFNKLTTEEPSLTTTIPFGKATIEDIYTIFNNLITDKSLYEINNIFNADPQFQAEWNKYGSITKNEPETKEQFIERMNSRIENGKYKQRDGTLVDVTDSYNPETWWVENQEELVKFKKGRQETLFTFDSANKKLQYLVNKYAKDGYSFRREQVVFPLSGTQTSRTANFAPNNRKIWKITVIKPLPLNREKLVLTDEDINNAVSDTQDTINTIFDNISDKTPEQILKYLETMEFTEGQLDLIFIIRQKLINNPTLRIIVNNEDTDRYGYYNPSTNTIVLNRQPHLDSSKATLENLGSTIVHELVHAFTFRALRNRYSPDEIEFGETIDRLYSIAKKQSKFSKTPAYSSVEEFLSAVLTDPTIMNEAMNMKLNVWQRILRAISRLIYGTSVYDEAYIATMEYIGKADIFAPTKASYDILNRDISEDIYLNQENPSHKEIWEKLNVISGMFTFDKPTHTYTLIKDAKGKKLKKEDQVVFSSATELMKRAKFLPGDKLSSDSEKAEKQRISRAISTGVGNVIHAISESDLKKIAIDISSSNGIKYEPNVVNQIETILKQFKRKGVTILSEVLVADLDLKIAGFIDLLIIDEKGKVHIYDFKTKRHGFEDYLIKKKYGGSLNLSDKERHSLQLSIYKNLFEKNTGIKVDTLNVVMLKPQVEDATIVNVELDKTHSTSGILEVPYTYNTKLVYRHSSNFIRTTSADTVFNEDRPDVELIKLEAEQFKNKLTDLLKSKKELDAREQIVVKSLMALNVKRTIIYRKGNRQEVQSIQKIIDSVTAETDVEKQLQILVNYAYATSRRIFNEYEKYKKNGKQIPLHILRGWGDSVAAFDAILNDKNGLNSIIIKNFGLKGGPDYKKILNETQSLAGMIKNLYVDLGTDQLVDFLSPYYHIAYAEARILKTKEYRRKNFLGQIPEGLSETDYVEGYIEEHDDDLQERTKILLRSELKKASRDVGLMTRWIDNLLDSKDPVTAAMVKRFVHADEKGRIEALEKRQQVVDIVRRVEEWYKANGGIPKSMEDFYGFMLEKVDGKYTGHYITQHKSSLIDEYKTIISAASSLEDVEDRKAYIRAWLEGDENIAGNWPLDKEAFMEAYWDYIEEQHSLGFISDSELKNLKDNQTYKNRATVTEMVENNALSFETGELLNTWLSNNTWSFRIPHEDWLNPQFNDLKKILDNPDDPRGDLYRLIQSMRMEGDSNIPFGYRLDSRFPGIIKQDHERIDSGQSIGEVIRGSLAKRFTFTIDDTSRIHEELLDQRGRPIYFLPIHFTGRVVKKVKKTNKDGEEYTIVEFDEKEQSFDLAGIYYKYWVMANDYFNKSQILPQMELAKHIINNRPTVKRNSMGEAIFRKLRGRGNVDDLGEEEIDYLEQTVDTSNLAQQVNDWFLSCVYGQYENDGGKWGKIDVTKLLNAINTYTSLNLLGTNFVAGTANVILGETLQRIESFVGEYMDVKDFAYADKVYLRLFPGILGDIGARAPKALGTHLVEYFGVFDDYGQTNMDVRTRMAQLAKTDTLYFTSRVGEHYMQSRFLFGMLANKQMVDLEGKPIGRLIDQYEMKDGKLQLKQKSTMSKLEYEQFLRKNKWTEDDQNEFKIKVRGILSRLHGEYSNLGRIAIQRNIFGRMAYLFRHFIVTGFKRRYGKGMYKIVTYTDPETGEKKKRRELNQDAYLERLGQFVEGNYITTGKYIGATVGTLFTKNEEHPEFSFWQRLHENLQSFKLSIFKEEWSSLTDHEKANIQRTLYEVGFLLVAVMLANLAMRFKVEADDDDDEFAEKYWAFAAYQAYRLQNELLFFSPKLDSAMSILRSPAASFSVMENLITLSGQIFHPTERYESGAWKGRPKIMKTLSQMTPLQRQFYRLGEMETMLPFMYKSSLSGTPKSVDERYTTETYDIPIAETENK